MIFIIDDDTLMSSCLAKEILSEGISEVECYSNGIEAMEAMNKKIPDLIFLDILLDGPDGFSFLNELSSYEDTEKIPVVIISSVNLNDANLSEYGVVKVLDKSLMTPTDIKEIIKKYAR